MIIRSVNLETVCGVTSRLPENDKPEIAFAGKSNVGKSSLINALMNRKAYARTSAQPGKTQTINFYNINDTLYYVDLPGYGYAKVSQAEKEKWARLLEDFFAEKENIAHVFALADIRHDPTADDLAMINFLYYHRIPFTVVATKADKLSKMRVKENVRKLAAGFKTGEGNIIAFSSETGEGKEKTLACIGGIVALADENKEPQGAEIEG